MSENAPGYLSNKRLVIFGCGYVGTAFARQALEGGAQVTALTRNETKAAALGKLGCEVVIGSLSSSDWHCQIAGDADRVLNCVSSGGGGIAGYRDSYVGGMQSVLAWAKQRKTGTIIYTGSSSVYPQDNGETVDETASTENGNERAALLLETERLLRDNGQACARWFVLRLTGIYGPDRSRLLDKIRAGEQLDGEPERWLNLVHRDDICTAIAAAFEASEQIKNEIFNVTDEGTAPKGEMAFWLAQQIGAPEPRFGAESRMLRRDAGIGRILSNAKIRAELGWTPRYPTYREGFVDLLKKL